MKSVQNTGSCWYDIIFVNLYLVEPLLYLTLVFFFFIFLGGGVSVVSAYFMHTVRNIVINLFKDSFPVTDEFLYHLNIARKWVNVSSND